MNKETIIFDRPILIVGACRSGKTLVKRIVSTLSDMAGGHEPFMIWNMGMLDHSDDSRNTEEATEDLVDRIRRRLHKYILELGGERYVDDMAHHALRLPFSLKILPDARLIYVLRNGQDNVAENYEHWTHSDTLARVVSRRLNRSTRKNIRHVAMPRHAWKWFYNFCRTRLGKPRTSWGPTVPGQREYARTHETLETVAFQWATMVNMLEDALAAVPTDRVLRVRYEDLLSDTSAQAARIADFCEVSDRGGVIDAALEIIDPNHAPKFEALSPQQWEQVLPIMKPMLEHQGYPTDLNLTKEP